jgi:hypothetical protein
MFMINTRGRQEESCVPNPYTVAFRVILAYAYFNVWFWSRAQVEARDDAAGADRRAASAQQQAQARQQELVRSCCSAIFVNGVLVLFRANKLSDCHAACDCPGCIILAGDSLRGFGFRFSVAPSAFT